MADLIGLLTLGLQYCLIISIINLHFGKLLPLWIVVPIFVIVAGVGLAVWHKKEPWQTVKQWRKLIFGSVILGIAFLAGDWLIAYINGQTNPLLFPGGLWGIPLTFAICPGFTIICVAGLVRIVYLNKVGVEQRQ